MPRKVGGIVGIALNSVLFVHEHPKDWVDMVILVAMVSRMINSAV